MQGPPWGLNEARMLWHKDPFCCGRPGCQIQWSRSSGVWGHWGDRTPPLGFDLWAYLAAVWISRGVSDCLCHGWWSRFSQPSETWFLLTTLACSSKMVAQSPQAYRTSQGENRTAALPQLRIYWAASGAPHLGGHLCMFPGINFVLLDSDCLPITLFEVEDLWTEAYLARFPVHSNSGIPRAHPLRAFKRFCNDPKVVDTQQQVGSTRMGQGALVVTEPHAELNAGLIVIFRSSHPPIFNWNAWSLRLRSSSGTVTDGVFKDEASTLAYAFWDRIGEFLQRSLTDNELSSEEKAQWVQSGLAISPLMGTCLQYSLDFCLAWDMDMRVPSFKNTKAVHHG